jgi:TPR repeat protein
MKQFFITMLLAPLFLVPSYAADFDAGWLAVQRGDFHTALVEFRPLAEEGNADAQFNLGVMYENGNGVVPDFTEAVKYYRLASAQGSARAQTNLGWMYERGDGVGRDYQQAAALYRLAAEQGMAQAHYRLAVMYYTGSGVPQNFIAAHMWANLAAAPGDEEAASLREAVTLLMSNEEVSHAQKLAKDCMENDYKGC